MKHFPYTPKGWDQGVGRYLRFAPARAADASHSSLLRVSTFGSIAIAAFCALYFSLQLLRGAL